MRKLIFPFITLVTLLAFSSCSEKFKIAAPYKDITVVYGYLDMNDTAHYIRIQKAFLDQNKSALTMAQTADSNFYASLNVRIKRMRVGDSLTFDTIHLNRVDLNAEGYPKEEGVFFTAPNYAYKFTNKLDPNYIYRIIITNLSTGNVDSAESPVIDDTKAGNRFTSNKFTDTANIDFASTIPKRTFEFYCQYIAPSDYLFQDLSSPAYVVEAILRFNWVDSDFTTHAVSPHYFDFSLGTQVLVYNSNFTQSIYSIANTKLYSALSSGMKVAPDHIIRLMDKCDLFIYLGSKDYYDYQQNSLTQGVGLTGNEIEPIYTNIKGKDALGLFTARGMRQGRMKISDQTIDSLALNPVTKPNNIRGRVR